MSTTMAMLPSERPGGSLPLVASSGRCLARGVSPQQRAGAMGGHSQHCLHTLQVPCPGQPLSAGTGADTGAPEICAQDCSQQQRGESLVTVPSVQGVPGAV